MLEKALEESDNNADISSIEKTEFLCIMGEWKCIIKSYSSIEEFERHKEDNKKSFSFKYYSEYYDMSYSYTSPLFEDNSSNHYIFPLTKRPKHDEGATLSFSMNGNQSLFEQLLNAYWQIFYEGFSAIDSAYITQNDGMTIYDMRKATPLMGFSYDDGLFEIKYRK